MPIMPAYYAHVLMTTYYAQNFAAIICQCLTFMLAKERPYTEVEDLKVVDDVFNEEQTLLQQLEHV